MVEGEDAKPPRPAMFELSGKSQYVQYVETMQVKEGVVCDVYAFKDDDTKDLAIVRVTKGYKTPLQRILSGNKTTEGFMEGQGVLSVISEDGGVITHSFDASSAGREVDVKVGQIMQWSTDDTDLVFYEICDPPYKDGRFEDLQDE